MAADSNVLERAICISGFLVMSASPSPRVRGEGGVRGRFRWAGPPSSTLIAQHRGEAPSPSFAEPVIGPATSGRTRWLSRRLPARRGEVISVEQLLLDLHPAIDVFRSHGGRDEGGRKTAGFGLHLGRLRRH